MLLGEIVGERRLTPLPQARGTLLDEPRRHLGHARGRRAWAWREGKDMQIGEPTTFDQLERVREHRRALGRKAGYQVRAEGHVGPQSPYAGAELDGIRACVAALHALQDHVIAGLQ